MQDNEIDDLLDLAAQQRPAPSPALIDRVLADALAQQPTPHRFSPHPHPQPGLLARLAAAFGGAPVLAGVCSSVVLGFAVGYMNPATIDYLTGELAGAETLDLFPSADSLMTEG